MALVTSSVAVETSATVKGELLPGWELVPVALSSPPINTSSATFVQFGNFASIPPQLWGGSSTYTIKIYAEAFMSAGANDGEFSISTDGTAPGVVAGATTTVPTATGTRTVFISSEFTMNADDLFVFMFRGISASTIEIESTGFMVKTP